MLGTKITMQKFSKQCLKHIFKLNTKNVVKVESLVNQQGNKLNIKLLNNQKF